MESCMHGRFYLAQLLCANVNFQLFNCSTPQGFAADLRLFFGGRKVSIFGVLWVRGLGCSLPRGERFRRDASRGPRGALKM